MAEYTYEQLKGMTVAQLRQIAQDLDSKELEGFSVMHKEALLPILCRLMGIHTHHAAEGANKTQIKAAIRKLMAKREAAQASGDHAQAEFARHQVHVLKHRLRRMALQA